MNEIILTDIERNIVETEGVIKHYKELIKNTQKSLDKYDAQLEIHKGEVTTGLYSDLKFAAINEIEKYKSTIEYLNEYLNVRYIQYDFECKMEEHKRLKEQNPIGGSNPWDL